MNRQKRKPMSYVKCCVAPPLAGLLLFSASQAVAGDPETFCVDTYVARERDLQRSARSVH